MGIFDKLFGKKNQGVSDQQNPMPQKVEVPTRSVSNSARPVQMPIAKPAETATDSASSIPEALFPNIIPARLKREFTVSSAGTAPKIPGLQGNYAKTVFLMMYAKGAVPASKPYPQYLLYECGITDAIAYRETLIAAGLLVEPDTEAILSGLKVADIKGICERLGIAQTGTKAALISKLLSEADANDLSKQLPNEKSYMLSKKGFAYLQKHEGYQIIHRNRNWSISWKEYDKEHAEDETPYATMIRIVQACLDKEKFNFIRNDYHALSEIYDQSGDSVKAAEMLLYVQYLDLSGMCSYDSIQLYRSDKALYKKKLAGGDSMFDTMVGNYAFSTFAPAIVDRISKWQSLISAEMIHKVSSWRLPVNACSAEEYQRIIMAIIEGRLELEKEQAQLKQRFIAVIG